MAAAYILAIGDLVDFYLFVDSPAKLLQDGKFNITPILAGVANDDGSRFLGNIPGMC